MDLVQNANILKNWLSWLLNTRQIYIWKSSSLCFKRPKWKKIWSKVFQPEVAQQIINMHEAHVKSVFSKWSTFYTFVISNAGSALPLFFGRLVKSILTRGAHYPWSKMWGQSKIVQLCWQKKAYVKIEFEAGVCAVSSLTYTTASFVDKHTVTIDNQ